MTFVLGPGAQASGTRLFSFDAIGSTNAEAMALARAGDPGNVWFAARRQTAGRGRRGRSWHTDDGNLAASMLLVVDMPPALAATLGLVAGLALDDALASLAAGAERGRDLAAAFRLKWPNDIVAGGAKLAGILLEAEKLPGDRLAVVVGIGVNVATAPSDTPYPATALAAMGLGITPEALFVELSHAWQHAYRMWNHGAGIAAVRNRWLERAAGLGQPVSIRAGEQVFDGVFETIDDAGHLILRRGDGDAMRISAGDVHFGAMATAAGFGMAAR